jgi:hypothetical protein
MKTRAIALVKRDTLKGAITAGGKPVANATVVISYEGTDFLTRTDDQGRYQAPDIKHARSITVLHPDYDRRGVLRAPELAIE